MASKHAQKWIEGGHDVKQNIPMLIHVSLPEKASHSTKRTRGPNPSEQRYNGGRQSNDGTPTEDNDRENRKRKPRGETNNSQAKKVKKTSQNKTATKSSNQILRPAHPKTAEYQASVSAAKEIYNSFATASSHRVFPRNHHLQACNPHPVCNPQ